MQLSSACSDNDILELDVCYGLLILDELKIYVSFPFFVSGKT